MKDATSLAPAAATDGGQHLFRPISRSPRLSDVVAEQILQRILDEKLRADDPLPSERELGNQFGVSRTVIREAVRALVAKGVVEARTGSGLRVAAVDGTAVTESLSLFFRSGGVNFEKLLEVRQSIEDDMAAIAAQRRTEADLEAIRKVHERFTRASGDVDEAAKLDVEFHAAIARATHNGLFLILLDSLGPSLLEVRRKNLAAGSWTDTVASHKRILESIAAGNGEGARLSMAEHLKDVGDWLNKRERDSSSIHRSS